MAGRPKKLGDERCPDPRCLGYLQLGRFRAKDTRSRPTSRYHTRLYFRHNDSKIPEHYVDGFTKLVQNNRILVEPYESIGHTFKRMAKRFITYPWEEQDLVTLQSALEWFRSEVMVPTQLIAAIDTGEIQDPYGIVHILRKWRATSLLPANDRISPELAHIYNKYERPIRLERNKKRNKKLSEWNGRKTDDYRGLEDPISTNS
jgi:hypothetical protein